MFLLFAPLPRAPLAFLKGGTSFRSLLCTSRAYFRSRGSPSIMRRAYFSVLVQFRRRRNGGWRRKKEGDTTWERGYGQGRGEGEMIAVMQYCEDVSRGSRDGRLLWRCSCTLQKIGFFEPTLSLVSPITISFFLDTLIQLLQTIIEIYLDF